jgi:hypothetical protein
MLEHGNCVPRHVYFQETYSHILEKHPELSGKVDWDFISDYYRLAMPTYDAACRYLSDTIYK